MTRSFNQFVNRQLSRCLLSCCFFMSSLFVYTNVDAQIVDANKSGFTWITPDDISETTHGAGFSFYTAAFPVFNKYPGPQRFQTGLASSWMSTRPTGTEPDEFYTTIEGGLGWWSDTRFATETPKFIMGGVSHNFYSWANGPGAGQTNLLDDDRRDWSESGGKYGIAQLSPNLLWPPDGLNMEQDMNGELLGYGYFPLPLTEQMQESHGQDIQTGNQCWTLFFNSENFKGPAAFFMPTFWTEPITEDPGLEGLFLDTRPSSLLGFGLEFADSPALISEDENGTSFAKVLSQQYPATENNQSLLVDQIKVYTFDALWNDMVAWFEGGDIVSPGLRAGEDLTSGFSNNGGDFIGEIIADGEDGDDFPIDLYAFTETYTKDEYSMGFEWNLEHVSEENGLFVTPEYFEFSENNWVPISQEAVPSSTQLIDAEIPITPRKDDLSYLTPMESDCHWQTPNNVWNSPGPVAGPFFKDLGDGSTITYYWYRFVDQPAVIHANLSENQRNTLQERVELIHTNWQLDQEYLAPPSTGELASIDSALLVTPPAGMEIGYVPIVTRQEKTNTKVKVFVLAGQSNMQGYGSVNNSFDNNAGNLVNVVENDEWSFLGTPDNWNEVDNVWLHFDTGDEIIKSPVTVGQGAYYDLIGPELMFAHRLSDLYEEEPILIIKTAWGGKSLAEDFRPPSASGQTGAYYTEMIETVQNVTQNLSSEFPNFNSSQFEIAGFAWFQGWNDGESEEFLNEYESSLRHLVSDIRNDWDVPNLPIVIANSGHGGNEINEDDLWVQGIQTVLAVAQENVGCDDDTYGGSVGFVDTKPFYYEVDQSPEEAIHHFNNNALTYLNIGAAIGEEMRKAIDNLAYCGDVPDSVSEIAETKTFIYPNPTNGLITIQNRDSSIEKVMLTDIKGRVLQTISTINQPQIELEIAAPSGVYMLQISTKSGANSTHRIVKIGE